MICVSFPVKFIPFEKATKMMLCKRCLKKTANRVSRIWPLRFFQSSPLCSNHGSSNFWNFHPASNHVFPFDFRPAQIRYVHKISSSSLILATLPPGLILSGPRIGSGSGSSFMHEFSSMFVHLPLVPAWLCFRCCRK